MQESLNTAYDDAFRTMIQKCDDLVFPMLNYMFGTNYTMEDRIIRSANEEFSQQGAGRITKRITDSQLIVISGETRNRYHVECESSTKTGSVLVRIFEYGSQIALDDAEFDDTVIRLVARFPHAAVLFLREAMHIPDKMTIEIRTPDGEGCKYHVPVMREADFTLEQIFEKKLYFLLPFYLFQYERRLNELNDNEDSLKNVLAEYEEIVRKLAVLVDEGRLSSRSRYVIIQMIRRVADKLAMKQENVKKKVGDLMGGQVIELDIFQAEDRAEARGKEIGKEIGTDLFASLIRVLTPGSKDYEDALNGTYEKRQELFKKYNIV